MSSKRVSLAGRYQGISEVLYQATIKKSFYIESFDGTRLAVDVVFPAELNGGTADGPFPVIFIASRDNRFFPEKGNGDEVVSSLVLHGYIIAVAQLRGCGASFGYNDSFAGMLHRKDSAFIINWVEKQPWCNGNVGMVGTSNRAFIQYATATLQPKALKAITPSVAITDFYYQNYPNGVSAVPGRMLAEGKTEKLTKEQLLEKVVPVDSDADGSIAYKAYEQDQYGRNKNFVKNLLFPNMLRDTPNQNFDGEPTNITIPPVTDIEKLVDSGVKQHQLIGMFESGALGQLAHYKKMGGSFVMGPWNHRQVRKGNPDVPEGLFDFVSEYHRWLDFSLKGLDNGFENAPPVCYYTVNAKDGEFWRYADTWPLENIKPAVLYLNSKKSVTCGSVNDGSLTQYPEEKAAGTDYKVDTSIQVFDNNDGKGGTYDRMMMYWEGDMTEGVDNKGLTFTSAPFFARYENQIAGCVSVDLWVSSSSDDADFIVYLEEVTSDGKSRFIKDGVIRASHRTVDSNKEWESLGATHHTSMQEDVAARLEEGMSEPVNLKFAIEPVSYIFGTGSRLRITITCADKNTYQHMYNENNLPVITVHTGGEFNSSITVPFVEHINNVYNGRFESSTYSGPGTMYFFDRNIYAYKNGSWDKLPADSNSAEYTIIDGVACFENAGFTFVHEGLPLKDGIMQEYEGGDEQIQPLPVFRHEHLDTVPVQLREETLYVPTEKTLFLDLFVKEHNPLEKKPCVIYIHGYGASFSVFTPQLQLLYENDYIIAGIDLRNYPPNYFPDYIHDIKGSVRFLRANAERFGIDPERIGSYGVSLGGNSTLMLAVSAEVPELEGEVGGNLEFSSRIQAAGAGYAWSDLLYMGSDITEEYSGLPELQKEKFDRTDGEYAPCAEVIDFAGKEKGIAVLREYLESGCRGTNQYLDSKLDDAFRASPINYCRPDCPPIALVGGLGMYKVDIANNQTIRTFNEMEKNKVSCFMYSNTKGNYARLPEICMSVLQFFENNLKNKIFTEKTVFVKDSNRMIHNYLHHKTENPAIHFEGEMLIPWNDIKAVHELPEGVSVNGEIREIKGCKYIEASDAAALFDLEYSNFPDKSMLVFEKK